MRKTEPPETYIRQNLDGSMSYVGDLATKLHQAQQLRAALTEYLGPASARRFLTIAQAFTGKRYIDADRMSAIADLDDWIAGMELIVPVVEETH